MNEREEYLRHIAKRIIGKVRSVSYEEAMDQYARQVLRFAAHIRRQQVIDELKRACGVTGNSNLPR